MSKWEPFCSLTPEEAEFDYIQNLQRAHPMEVLRKENEDLRKQIADAQVEIGRLRRGEGTPSGATIVRPDKPDSEFPDVLHVIVATHDDGLSAIRYFAASADQDGHARHFPSRRIVQYMRIR